MLELPQQLLQLGIHGLPYQVLRSLQQQFTQWVNGLFYASKVNCAILTCLVSTEGLPYNSIRLLVARETLSEYITQLKEAPIL